MTIRTMIVSLISITCAAHGYGASAADDAAFFSKSVQPILADNCIKCHGPDRQKGHLRLDSRDAVLAGGKSGPAIVVGKPEESVLIKAVRYTDDDLQMPPKKQLSDDDIKVLVDWVTRGAPWSADAAAATPKPDSPKQP
jgi:mono/diheme cytochrome c family protein